MRCETWIEFMAFKWTILLTVILVGCGIPLIFEGVRTMMQESSSGRYHKWCYGVFIVAMAIGAIL